MKKSPSQVEQVVNGIVDFLTERGQGDLLFPVVENLDTLTSSAKQENKIMITSAVKLSEVQLKVIQRILSQLVGKNLTIKNVIDRSLIGGFTISVGDFFLDASIAHDMLSLKQLLLN